MMQRRLQFSVRALLLLTALVAVVLAVAVQLPLLFWVSVGIGAILLALQSLVWSVSFATSERRPRLAVISWMLFGGVFTGIGLLVWSILQSNGAAAVDSRELAFYILMGVCTLVCLVRAGTVCRGMRRPAMTADGASAEANERRLAFPQAARPTGR
jgi:hypothetical protein